MSLLFLSSPCYTLSRLGGGDGKVTHRYSKNTKVRIPMSCTIPSSLGIKQCGGREVTHMYVLNIFWTLISPQMMFIPGFFSSLFHSIECFSFKSYNNDPFFFL